MRLCLVGDTGTGGEMQAMVAKSLEQRNCSAIIFLGDVIYPNGLTRIDDNFEVRFLDPYKKIMVQGIPIYIALGNHDYRGNPDIWRFISKLYPDVHFPNRFYFKKMNDVCLIVVDTNANYGTQIKWLNSLDRKLKACQFKIAAGHHPLNSSGHHGKAKGARRNLLLTVAKKVNYYFAGHDHQLSLEKPVNGTQLVIAGGGGAKTRPIENPNQAIWSKSAYGYVTLDFNGKKPNLRFWQIASGSQ